MTFTIRTTTRADLAAVDALLARSYPKLLKRDYAPSVLVLALPLISRAQPRLLASGTYFLAETEDRVVGVGGWTTDRRDRRLAHIRHVGTDDRFLRQGVASALLRHCFDTARKRGVTRMECWSTRTAVSFYAHMGFEELGPMDVDLAPGIRFPSIRMIRAL